MTTEKELKQEKSPYKWQGLDAYKHRLYRVKSIFDDGFNKTHLVEWLVFARSPKQAKKIVTLHQEDNSISPLQARTERVLFRDDFYDELFEKEKSKIQKLTEKHEKEIAKRDEFLRKKLEEMDESYRKSVVELTETKEKEMMKMRDVSFQDGIEHQKKQDELPLKELDKTIKELKDLKKTHQADTLRASAEISGFKKEMEEIGKTLQEYNKPYTHKSLYYYQLNIPKPIYQIIMEKTNQKIRNEAKKK